MKKATTGRRFAFRVLAVLVTTLVVGSIYINRIESCCDSERTVYATTGGLGPDKWASIWLVQRYLNPDVRVPILGQIPENHDMVLFDTPGSQFFRDNERTTTAKLRNHYVRDNRVLDQVVSVIHDIEVNMWLPDRDSRSKTIEQAYRDLQLRYDRYRVPYECYMEFFDNVEGYLSASENGVTPSTAENLLPAAVCGEKAMVRFHDDKKLVPELSPDDVFDLIRSGKSVAFLDVREPEEFAEFHIPGAVNVQIRNLDDEVLTQLASNDLIVSYCIKDFRGFEMARLIRRAGIDKAAIMYPYGIKGWIDSGLPIFRAGSVTRQDALDSLQACINRQPGCKSTI